MFEGKKIGAESSIVAMERDAYRIVYAMHRFDIPCREPRLTDNNNKAYWASVEYNAAYVHFAEGKWR